MATLIREVETMTTSTARKNRELRKTREIAGIYASPGLHWVGDGFRVAGYFAAIPDAVRRLDPFLLLDYHPVYNYAPTKHPRGVGVHPHRGFETVTLAWQGSVEHHDSTGGGGVIGPGDVQWMTAAAGILHKEYHEPNFSRAGGPFHMAQLWVNLPAAHKMDAPRYQPLLAEQMGTVTLLDGGGTVRVIAGEYLGTKGPAKTFTRINVFDATLAARGTLELDFPASDNTAVLVMKGNVVLNGATTANSGSFVLFENVGDHITVEAEQEAQLLVLSGEPINEPVVQYGPFVMNTEKEIVQAFRDLETGKFGHLDD
jgi:redox-sensitive bicupin YhaK (pirin superfamily)